MRKTLDKIGKAFETRYKEIMAVGTLFCLLAAALYRYQYYPEGDEVMGLIIASAWFLGIILTGQGIRGWRDAAQWSARFVRMKTRNGATISIKKRVKKKWR